MDLFAINFGLVGAFPYKKGTLSAAIHNQVALNLVLVSLVLLIGIHFFLPKSSKEFQTTSYLTAGFLAMNVILFTGVGYLSLTAFELLSFCILFFWLLTLFRYLQHLILEEEMRQQVTIFLKH